MKNVVRMICLREVEAGQVVSLGKDVRNAKWHDFWRIVLPLVRRWAVIARLAKARAFRR